MSILERKGWGDRFDRYGTIAGFVLFVVLGALLGSFEGWLAALALAFGVMNVTAVVLRRRSGSQPPARRLSDEESESFGPRRAPSDRGAAPHGTSPFGPRNARAFSRD
jgi:hypothetical protein